MDATKIKPFTKMKFMDIPIGHYFMGNNTIFKSVKSKEVLSHTFAPEFPVMVCYHSFDDAFKKDQVTEDFFQVDFHYLSDDQTKIDLLIEDLKKDVPYKKATSSGRTS